MLQPYDYQQDCLRSIDEARNQGKEKALVVMASGLGKTITAAFDTKKWFNANPKSKVLYLCHQNDILSQARTTFQLIIGGNDYLYGYYHGYEKSRQAQFLFASFQTMRKRSLRFDRKEFDYIIVDESHHVPATTYMPVVCYFKPKFLLGMTATPDRTDMRDIRTLFGDEVYSLSLSEALAHGLLTSVDYRLLTDEIVEFGKLENPYKMSLFELNKKIFVPKRDREIVDIINNKIALIKQPRVMIFCPSIRYTEELRKYIPNAVPVHSGLSRRTQEARIQEFRNGSLSTILTVDKFNEGVDIPEINVIVFLRSTQSKTVFYQQFGRGLRKVPGKTKVLVLDFIANCERLLMVNELVESTEKVSHNRPKIGEYEPKEALVVNGGAFQFSEIAKDVLDVLEKIKTGYTPEILIEQLQREATLLGRSPVVKDIIKSSKEMRTASYNSFVRTFKCEIKENKNCCWACVLKAANLKIPKNVAHLNNDNLIAQLRLEAELLKRLPTQKDIGDASKKGKMVSVPTFLHRFKKNGNKSWQYVLESAGFIFKNRRAPYTQDELIKYLKTEAKKLGKSPSTEDIERASKAGRTPSWTVYFKFMKMQENMRWKDMLRLAGLEPHLPTRKSLSSQQLINQICAEAELLGRNPTTIDIGISSKAGRTAGLSTFLRNFERDGRQKWTHVLKAAKLI